MQGRDVAFWPSLHNPHIIRTVCLYWDGWQAWDSKKKKNALTALQINYNFKIQKIKLIL